MNTNSNTIFQIVLIPQIVLMFLKLEVESATHFFLHCLCFSSICETVFNELVSICKKFIDLPDSSTGELLFYENPDLSFIQNSVIINASINYKI